MKTNKALIVLLMLGAAHAKLKRLPAQMGRQKGSPVTKQNMVSQRVLGQMPPQTINRSQEYKDNLVDTVKRILGEKMPKKLVDAILNNKQASQVKKGIEALQLFVLRHVNDPQKSQGQKPTQKGQAAKLQELLADLKTLKTKAQKQKLMSDPVNRALMASDIMPSQWHEFMQTVQKKTQEKKASSSKIQTTIQSGKPNQRGQNVKKSRQEQTLDKVEIKDLVSAFMEKMNAKNTGVRVKEAVQQKSAEVPIQDQNEERKDLTKGDFLLDKSLDNLPNTVKRARFSDKQSSVVDSLPDTAHKTPVVEGRRNELNESPRGILKKPESASSRKKKTVRFWDESE